MVMNRRMRDLFAGVIFLGISLIYFGIPIVTHLATRYVGQGEDPIQYVNAMLWWPWAILHGHNPFIDHWLWAPVGQSLLWVTSVPSISLALSPVTLSLGPVASYNIAMILGPAMSAFSMYLLLGFITKRYSLQLFAAYMFGFSTYTLGQTLGHLHLIWNFPIPLLVMIAIRVYRTFEKQEKPRAGLRILAIVLIVFLFGASVELVTTFSFTSSIFMLIAWLVIKRTKIADERREILISTFRSTLLWLASTYVVSLVLLSPMILFMLLHRFYTGYPNNPTIFSSDLLNYFVPTDVTIGGRYFTKLATTFSGNWSEQGAYLGIPFIALVVLSATLLREKIWARITVITLAVVAIFTLGPVLHIAGHRLIPLPWAVIMHIPFIKDALPTRLTMYVSLLSSLIVAMGLDSLLAVSKHTTRKTVAIISSLSLLFLLPNVSLGQGVRWTNVSSPPLFSSLTKLKTLIPHQSNVLVFPYGPYGDAALLQAESHFFFRLANGYLGEMPSFMNAWPLATTLWNSPDIPTGRYFSVQLGGLLAQQNVTRIVALKGYRHSAAALVSQVRGVHRIHSGQQVYVWAVNTVRINHVYSGGPKITASRADVVQFRALLDATRKWLLANSTRVSQLSPSRLEDSHLLSKDLGGYSVSAPNWNWTAEGGWAGPWGNGLYGIGITGTGYEINPIVQRYRKQSIQIYFPYPHLLKHHNPSYVRRLPLGELAITFAQPQQFYNSQFSSLLKASYYWVSRGLPLSSLSPHSLEEAGLLNPEYGGFPKSQANWQWTTDGGWAGAWRAKHPSFAIGLYGPYNRLAPIILKYRGIATQILYPYPHRLTSVVPPRHALGQAVFVFPAKK